MSRAHVRHHFNGMFGEMLEQVTPAEKSAWVGITIDSYEGGSQNWTDGFDAAFEKRNGYNPILLLPVMTGPANPVPAGYDYDYMGSDAIMRKLHVVDGEWVVLPAIPTRPGWQGRVSDASECGR